MRRPKGKKTERLRTSTSIVYEAVDTDGKCMLKKEQFMDTFSPKDKTANKEEMNLNLCDMLVFFSIRTFDI